MSGTAESASALSDLLAERDGVATTGELLRHLTPEAVEWRLASGRWQRPCRGLVVMHSGPLTTAQQLWVACLWAGPGAVLGGLTAARLDGLRGFDAAEDPVYLVKPPGSPLRKTLPALRLVVHYSRHLGEADVHAARQPPRTRVARSLVDAAAWAQTDRRAEAILAAGVQQRLVLPEHLTTVLERNQRVRRRQLMRAALADIAGGAHALSELDFLRRVIRPYRLPEPDRQVARLDAQGRRRWLDATWDRARLIVEIDGAAHADIVRYWDDMDRDNGLLLQGYDTLRYAAFAVRYRGDYVAGQIRQALRSRGVEC